ncbi:(2E,6E)-farnesyl diphosphate synthase [Thalassotalea mangrovi]|uniref:(2E,6E)-farnesyl diphosphate synthase n=1 Tax=Thalassotalea mangrovi TaxID=2572245 RepID=A0A4U1B4V4_9GAMM|nr:(2E,6E)-farnesyl diphosphate synthase [Thalassotalea mangrovi]TKB44500.1 (2E,6E)-farnesyl diphosphate synthase [Thalassotalea mangrovi]
MATLANLTTYQQRIDDFLKQQLAQLPLNDTRLMDAMHYGLLIGGKRMRPFLTYSTGEMLGVALADLDPIAAALECIHAYSLLHDDLPAMDDDDLRRGQPTCHKQFDEATAILAGDSLQTLAFDIVASHNFQSVNARGQIQLVKMLARASGYRGMCGGQAMDLAATDKQVDLDHLERIHRLKTGALLEAAILMPTLCVSDIDPAHVTLLKQYAQTIGLLYQVHDDIIDITSSEATLGKPSGSDIEANKSTYPALLGLSGAQQKEQELYANSLHALDGLPYNTQNLANFSTFIVKRDH